MWSIFTLFQSNSKPKIFATSLLEYTKNLRSVKVSIVKQPSHLQCENFIASDMLKFCIVNW